MLYTLSVYSQQRVTFLDDGRITRTRALGQDSSDMGKSGSVCVTTEPQPQSRNNRNRKPLGVVSNPPLQGTRITLPRD